MKHNTTEQHKQAEADLQNCFQTETKKVSAKLQAKLNYLTCMYRDGECSESDFIARREALLLRY